LSTICGRRIRHAGRAPDLFNKAGLRLLGAGSEVELLGLSGRELSIRIFWRPPSGGVGEIHSGSVAPRTAERVYVRLDKSLVNVEVSVIPITFLGKRGELLLARDITERKRLEKHKQQIEAQLRQQQKLEAIGTLAGGVAHEINNPLNGIMNYAQLIYDQSDEASANAEYASEIIHETERSPSSSKTCCSFPARETVPQLREHLRHHHQTISLVNTVIKKDQIILTSVSTGACRISSAAASRSSSHHESADRTPRDALNEKYPDYDKNKVIRVRCVLAEDGGQPCLRLTASIYGSASRS
jgi:hypothetical protein